MSKLLQEALARTSLAYSGGDDSAGLTSEDSEAEASLPPTPLDSRPPSPRGSRKRTKALDTTATDPLRRLPNPLSCRIFIQLNEKDLKTLRRVSKRYKRSSTLNFIWFCKFQARGFDDSFELPLDPTWKPTWTRRESKEDWFARYKRTYRRDDLEYRTADEADSDRGTVTPREENEARWAAEAAQSETLDKAEARSYYKSLKNSKAKGKTKFAGASSRDRSGAVDDSF